MDWISQIDGLDRLEAELRQPLMQSAKIRNFKQGETIFGGVTKTQSLLLLLEGRMRIQRLSDTGRAIVLYRVSAGQGCLMTAACLMAYDDIGAEGISETPIRAVEIPRAMFERLTAQSETFRSYVFENFAQRMNHLFEVIDGLAFGRIDLRLAQTLLALCDVNGALKMTHAQLAAEIGSAREVVSRILKDFEDAGLVKLGRGRVQVLDMARLGALTSLN